MELELSGVEAQKVPVVVRGYDTGGRAVGGCNAGNPNDVFR
jgi:hypothetical protein